MTDEITVALTLEQRNALYDGLDEIREMARDGALYEITRALDAMGLEKPSALITAVQDEIARNTIRLQMLIIQADTAPRTSRAMPKWFWPINKSNREA